MLTFRKPLADGYNYDICIIDTNILINSDLLSLFEYGQSIILLGKLRNKYKQGKVYVHIKVFAEILKYGMSPNNDLINLVSRRTYQNLKDLKSNGTFEIIIPESYTKDLNLLIDTIVGVDIYADTPLYQACKHELKQNRSLLFISDDKKEDSTLAMLKGFLNAHPKYKSQCRLMSGQEFVSVFREDLKALNHTHD